MKHLSILILSLSLLLGVSSCKNDNPTESTPKPTAQKPRVKVPKFDGDKAYALVEKQLSFGHRIPGTLEHKATKDWYVEQLKAAGADVQVQEFKASFWAQKIKNLIILSLRLIQKTLTVLCSLLTGIVD